jgi:hypothetical protein
MWVKGNGMVSTSNDGIMTEYLVKYGAIQASAKERPSDLLETLYITDCYRAGKNLQTAKQRYDSAMWDDIAPAEIDARLSDLSRFMVGLARDRAALWGVEL